MIRKTIFSLLAVIAAAGPALCGSVYYVTKSGNDSRNGLSWSTAWATIEKLNSVMNAGDTVYFGTGIWYNSQIRPPGGGNLHAQTLYACSTMTFESQYDPRIYGGEPVRTWSHYAGNVWAARFVGAGCYEDGCGSLGQDETPLQLTSNAPSTLSEGEYWYSKSRDSIYVWCFNGDNPNDCEMVASCKPALYFDTYNPDIAYVKFWGLDFRWGQQGTVYIRGRTNNNSIEHCHISRAGHTSANGSCVFIGATDNGKVATDSSTFGHYNAIKSCLIGNALTIDTSWSIGISDGIVIYSEKYFTIDSCYFYAPIGTAINIKGKGSGTTLEGNKARFNTIVEPSRNGIEVWVHPYRDSIYGNVIVNAGIHSINLPVSTLPYRGETVVLNNTVFNPSHNGGDCGVQIWVSNSEDGDCGQGHEIKYNVFYSVDRGVNFSFFPNSDCQDSCLIDSNMYYDISVGNECESGTSWNAWQSCGFDHGGLYGVNPGFLDPQNGDFSRPSASQEMSRGDYGDRYWTVWGAVQPNIGCTLPNPPALASPSDGAVDVGWPVYLDWNDASDKIRYQIQIHTDPSFIGPVIDFQPSQSSYSTSSLYPETLHYWRVRVLSECGWGGWSPTRHFETSGLGTGAEEDTGYVAAEDVEPHMYPNPYRLNEEPHAVFTGAPPGSALLIVTSTGERIRRWGDASGGDIIWDGTNEHGDKVASGVYLWYLEGTDRSGKFTVIR